MTPTEMMITLEQFQALQFSVSLLANGVWFVAGLLVFS